MCAIFGSKSKDKLLELYELNKYRGQLSNSLGGFDLYGRKGIVIQRAGALESYQIDNFPYHAFYIGHTQAPTTEANNSIHPAIFGDFMLWHNGIVKQKTLSTSNWDTYWMLEGIMQNGFEFLNEVDGTFACVLYYYNELYFFRNEISPLFVDDELNVSSTKFEGSKSLAPNTVFRVDLLHDTLTPVASFTTKENPYYFGDL